MNRLTIAVLVCSGLLMSQCRAPREVVTEKVPARTGWEGMKELCMEGDTIRNMLISKAETIIRADDERYEATVSLFIIKDSLIYMSAVNNGFEILRATADNDTIRVIDRMNRILYLTPVRKRFGYQHPLEFNDLQNIISMHFVCRYIEMATENDFDQITFRFDRPRIKKEIKINGNTLKMENFEFSHAETGKYLRGERTGEEIRIYSNFMISEFEVRAWGGSVSYNQDVNVKMEVNPRKYSIVNL